MEVVLTGIKPTGKAGTLHIGNYVGAMKPAVAASRNPNVHSITSSPTTTRYRRRRREAIAPLDARGRGDLARGRARSRQRVFYRQSDIPEIFELTWILSA